MNVLSKILSSRVRAEVFRLLFGIQESELHVRELARRSGMNESSVRQELLKLDGLGLVSRRKDGNRAYYRANRKHPLYAEIHSLVIKTSGLVELLQIALQGVDVSVVFIFGSVAKGEENADSDIDLVAIGDAGLRMISPLLSGISGQLGREINPHVMSSEEYRGRMKSGDHFVTHVLKGPKLFIVGTNHDLERMGR
jgi:DNA-binding transcriptional ArsR family regulator